MIPSSLTGARDDYPTITGIAGDLADVASLDIPYNTAHIDFCGGISVDNILTAANIMGNAYTHPAVFAVTMLKGREYLGSTGLMKDTPRARRRRLMLDARKKGMPSGNTSTPTRSWTPGYYWLPRKHGSAPSLQRCTRLTNYPNAG